jgi:hypothetical protein
MMVLFAIFACSDEPKGQIKEPATTDAIVEQPAPEPKAKPSPPKLTESSDSVFISEVMISPLKVAKYRGEWIELNNPTSEPVNLNQYTLLSNGDSGIQFGEEDIIPPNSTFLLASRKSATGNGGLPKVDFVYKSQNIKINKNDSIELKSGDVVIDRWDIEGSQVKKGYSLQRDSDGTLCFPDTVYGDGDFGTPKKVNQCSQ